MRKLPLSNVDLMPESVYTIRWGDSNMEQESADVFEAIARLNSSGTGTNILHAAVSTADGFSVAQSFGAPDQKIDLRSVSKVLSALAFGAESLALEARGRPVSVETPVAPFFTDYLDGLSGVSRERWSRVTVGHLLSNTIGHRDGFMFRADVAGRDHGELLQYIFSVPLDFEPGEHFSYSNAGWYLLAALLRQGTDVSLAEALSTHIFEPLGLRGAEVGFYGPYEIGASGIKMTGAQLHEVARLFLSGRSSVAGGSIPAAWIDQMGSRIYATSEGQDPTRALQYVAYGYGMWSTAAGYRYCDGSAGQFLGVNREGSVVVTAVGDSESVTPVVNALAPLLSL